eukprot:gene11392-13244_t
MGNKSSLQSGETCKPNNSLKANGYELRFQDDLNLVLYKGSNAYWASESGATSNVGKDCDLVMEAGGNLKMGTYWESKTGGNPGAFLKLEDYGVATIYSADGTKVLWTSSVLPSGAEVPAEDKSIFSSCMKYELVFQKDGNLVLYEHQISSRTALWVSYTYKNAKTLRLKSGGDLVIYDNSNDAVWSTNTDVSGSHLKVEKGFISVSSGATRLWTSLGENWMSRLPDDTKIASLSIPGSHETCASRDPIFGIPGITKDTAKCQDFDLTPQLRMGVRFVDIRLKKVGIVQPLPHDKAIYVLKAYHGMVEQEITFAQILEKCNKFLTTNSKEIIFMSIRDEGDGVNDSIQPMTDAALQAASVVTANTMPETLGAARGKIVLLRRYGGSSLGIDLYSNFPGNETQPALMPSGVTTQRFHIQDVFEPENYGSLKNADKATAIATKITAVDAALAAAASYVDGTAVTTFHVNFVSAVYFVIRSVSPDTVMISKPLNEHVMTYLKANPQVKTGFLLMDWMTTDMAHEILFRNIH